MIENNISRIIFENQNAMIGEALTIVRDDLAIIPFLQPAVAWAMRKNIDAPYVPNNRPYFYRFSVDKTN